MGIMTILYSSFIRQYPESVQVAQSFVKWTNFDPFPSLLASLTSDQVHRVHRQRPTARSILGQ